ncbi:MAG: GNAT family N-acetyltransferase [Haloarculaceae archaeon]
MSHSVDRLTERQAIAEGVALWNEHVPEFAVPDWLVEQNVYSPFDGVSVTCWGVREGGTLRSFAVVKRLTRPVGDYDPTETAWLSLFAFDPDGGASAGRTLLRHVADECRATGATTLRVGCSPQNLLAGVPDGFPQAYVEALREVGFELGDPVYDLERAIDGYTVPEAQRATAEEWPDLSVVRATGREEELLAFLAEQFPGRWRYEAENICRRPGGPADFWLLRHEGEAAGFLRSNRHDGAYRGSNVNWGARFADAHCGVGPLGVHEDCRGRGWGLYMIATVLEQLAADGYDHCVIDWTDLPGYYEQLGFERWVAYRTTTLDLSD